jgi:hypothetical protein
MDDESIAGELQNELSMEGIQVTSFDELKEKLDLYFNDLIQHDFYKLLNLMYRVDISEDKLRQILDKNPDENAGKQISMLVIERLSQKIRSRKEFRSNPESSSNDPGAEKW